MTKGKVIVLDRYQVESEAWLSLSGSAMKVFLLFRTKCQIDKLQGKPGKRRRVILNNGEIVFTYREAQKKYGISSSRFRRAIDELIAKGFIDITATGMGVYRVATFYAISERWQDYGTPGFKEFKRPKTKITNPGFKKGNKVWQKARKKKSSDENAHSAVYTIEHGRKIIIQYKRRNNKWLSHQIA